MQDEDELAGFDPFPYPPPFEELFVGDGQTARYIGLRGGRGSGKSHAAAEKIIIDSLEEPGLLSVMIREVQRTLRQSSKRLLENKIRSMGYSGPGYGFKVFKEVIETPGDGLMIFNGMQDHTAESIKSLEGFRRVWAEEAQNLTPISLSLLRPTIRAAGGQMIYTWNPTDAPDPEHPEYSVDGLFTVGNVRDLPMGGVLITTSWKDMADYGLLSADLIAEEAYDRVHRQPEDYAHIWGGAYRTRSAARVFNNWIRRGFALMPGSPPPRYLFGADFGYSQDPAVLVRMFVGRWYNDDANSGLAIYDPNGRVLFIDREAYMIGCEVDHTPALFAGNCPFPVGDHRRWENPHNHPGIPGALDWPIIADSARPETISYCQRHGMSKMTAAKKGQGSVEDGIEFLKGYSIVVHDDCRHTADELTYYSWKVDPKNPALVLPVLVDKKNHVIDAARYALEQLRNPVGFFS